MKETVLHKIEEADMVLVGIGEEWNGERELKEDPAYLSAGQALKEAGKAWALPALHRYLAESEKGGCRQLEALVRLAALLEKKNFFLVSVETCGFAADSAVRQDRVVAPCGGPGRKQCEDHHITPLSEEEKSAIRACIRSGAIDRLTLAPCPICGRPTVLNNIYAEPYEEGGYLPQWEKYTKWLQGTLNKRLCVLELGVGLRYPGVIRFPFEKAAYYNQKAVLIRVHESLYQLPEGMGERGISVKENAVDFLMGLPLPRSCGKL